MARNPNNSKWFLPLFSGAESVKTRGAAGQYDVEVLLPTLPGGSNNFPVGMILWVDSSAPSTVLQDADGYIFRVLDRSGNHVVNQRTPAIRPSAGGGINFED